MSNSKPETTKHLSVSSDTSSAATIHENILHSLPPAIRNEVKYYLAPQERIALACADQRLFRPGFYLTQLLSAVVYGEPAKVIEMARLNPKSLFSKGNITDACGQVFHNVSPLQLILFLFDWDMLNKIKPFINHSEEFRATAHQQCLELQGGGADLVKMDRDPRTVPFIELTRYIEGDATYYLLENKDGIIFWNNQFFYANKETQTVTLITSIVPEDEQHVLDALLISLSDMENNSSRRTSTVEYEFFTRTMGYRLERNGIHYELNGVHYQDVRDGVALINAYRKYIRIYETHQPDTPWGDVDRAWIDVVGQAQRILPIHILQRFCEDKPFSPLPTINDLSLAPFNRSLQIYNCLTGVRGVVAFGSLGTVYTIYKVVGWGRRYGCVRGSCTRSVSGSIDLAAVLRIKEVGKANVAEFMQELDLDQCVLSGRSLGAGCVVS
jgi:hypothetical protein